MTETEQTARIILVRPINLAGGAKGARTINDLELRPLRAGHFWDCPVGDLGARHTLTIGARAAGFDARDAEKLARELSGQDLAKVAGWVNAELAPFEEGVKALGLETEGGAEEELGDLGEVTITLREPVTLGKEEIDSLVLRPLKGADVWDVPTRGITFGHLLSVAASQAGQADAVVKRLGVFDVGQVVGAVNAFLARFPATGGAP